MLGELKEEHKTIVSLKTETYKRGNSFVAAKVLTTLKRKSTGFDILNGSVADEVGDLRDIEGVYLLPDGEYELVYANPSRDWESGVWEFEGYALKAV
jgi:hypothetical protein